MQIKQNSKTLDLKKEIRINISMKKIPEKHHKLNEGVYYNLKAGHRRMQVAECLS